jgi:hypothetical protein
MKNNLIFIWKETKIDFFPNFLIFATIFWKKSLSSKPLSVIKLNKQNEAKFI